MDFFKPKPTVKGAAAPKRGSVVRRPWAGQLRAA
jgi:hypothetical protein